MKTYSAKPSDVTRKWYLIDASENTLGRVSTKAAKLLLGKDKTTFTKHIDVGDYVVIINAAKINVTGYKLDTKKYYSHSGFPGGLKEITLRDKHAQDPTYAVIHAIRGMLPVNKLRPARLERLKVYAGSEHEQTGQKPEAISVNEVKGSK